MNSGNKCIFNADLKTLFLGTLYQAFITETDIQNKENVSQENYDQKIHNNFLCSKN